MLKFSHKQRQILRTCAIYIAKQLSLENAARTKTPQTKAPALATHQGSAKDQRQRSWDPELGRRQLQLSHVKAGSCKANGITSSRSSSSTSSNGSILWSSLSASKIPRNALKATSADPQRVRPLDLAPVPVPHPSHRFQSQSLASWPQYRWQIRKRARSSAN